MSEAERRLRVLEEARAEFGAEALRRLEGPVLALAGRGPCAASNDPYQQPGGLFIPELKTAAWHDPAWIPDHAAPPVGAGRGRGVDRAALQRPARADVVAVTGGPVTAAPAGAPALPGGAPPADSGGAARPAAKSSIQSIAQAIYEEGRFSDMPVLADALEEAGCDDAELLSHCREPGEHVRGCWVIDLLLGKE